jgi:hypothetical protein
MLAWLGVGLLLIGAALLAGALTDWAAREARSYAGIHRREEALRALRRIHDRR